MRNDSYTRQVNNKLEVESGLTENGISDVLKAFTEFFSRTDHPYIDCKNICTSKTFEASTHMIKKNI